MIRHFHTSTNGGNPPITVNEGYREMERQAGQDMAPVEGGVLPGSAWTFDMVQDRLVEAVITCWRNPDRERGWQRLRSMWPEISRIDDGDHSGVDALAGGTIRPASLTRLEVAEMEEAFGWMDAVPASDRKLIGLAVSQLARGGREVSWRRLLRPMGMERGVEGLRKRYGRAIAGIAARLNGGNPRAIMSTR